MTKAEKTILLCFLLILSGCKERERDCKSYVDLTKEHQYFLECINSQRQPTNNNEDDNGHFIEACHTASHKMAWSITGKDCAKEENFND